MPQWNITYNMCDMENYSSIHFFCMSYLFQFFCEYVLMVNVVILIWAVPVCHLQQCWWHEKRGGGTKKGSSGTRVRLCPGGSNYKHHFKQYESHNSVFSFINLKTSSLRLHFQFYNRVCFIVNIVPTPSWLCTTAVKYSSILQDPLAYS